MIAPVKEDLVFHIRESYYNGELPYFHEAEDFPELKVITDNWQVIWQEVQDYEKRLGNITGINTYSPPEVSGANPWNNIYLDNFMWRFHKNRKNFPKTCALLAQVPSCTLAGISVLSPHGVIQPHYGDTNAVIRCHLGLQVPAPYPQCGIRAGTEERGWQDGKLTLFTEAHLHTTWNKTDHKRYLLVFDIVHPQWADKKYWICAKVLGAQSFVFLEEQIPLLKKIPDSLLPLFHLSFSLVWRLYLPLQRSLSVFYGK